MRSESFKWWRLWGVFGRSKLNGQMTPIGFVVMQRGTRHEPLAFVGLREPDPIGQAKRILKNCGGVRKDHIAIDLRGHQRRQRLQPLFGYLLRPVDDAGLIVEDVGSIEFPALMFLEEEGKIVIHEYTAPGLVMILDGAKRRALAAKKSGTPRSLPVAQLGGTINGEAVGTMAAVL